MLTPDQRREALAVQRLETTLGTALTFDPPGRQRLGEALEPARAEVRQLKQATHEPPRRLADNHCAGLGQRLEPRREIRRLADHRLIPGRTLADEIEVDENEIRTDVFRSGGPGGQSVNTTDSAVRLTHLPTGIVVSCQNEKSQLQNKASAMVVLKAKLLARKKAEEAALKKDLKGDVAATWGDQMRNYVLNPYQMVKDLRTNHESGNPQSVLDGEIDDFIEAGIRWRRNGQNE